MEIFRDIEGYEGLYQVSNYGYIKALERIVIDKNGKQQTRHECILKGWIDAGGYLMVGFNKENKRKAVKVHRLVAEYFIPNPENKREVNHIDRNKLNNHISNLEWCTPKENMKHLEDNFMFDFGRKRVAMCDDNFNIISEFNSISDAGKFLNLSIKNNKPQISSIVRALKKGFRAYGYRWKYL